MACSNRATIASAAVIHTGFPAQRADPAPDKGNNSSQRHSTLATSRHAQSRLCGLYEELSWNTLGLLRRATYWKGRQMSDRLINAVRSSVELNIFPSDRVISFIASGRAG